MIYNACLVTQCLGEHSDLRDRKKQDIEKKKLHNAEPHNSYQSADIIRASKVKGSDMGKSFLVHKKEKCIQT
jgi:hypothetical protein